MLLIIGQTILGIIVLAQGLFVGATSHTITIVEPAYTTPSHKTAASQATSSLSTKASAATSTPPKKSANRAKPATVVAPNVLPTAAERIIPVIPGDYNAQTRAALVNILCTTKAGGYFKPISGSGVFISSAGVVLTNAHVGQYFLLTNYPTTNNILCTVRTGSPAVSKYTARLLYLPPAWINTNADQITSQKAMGTGENDYAFLLITGSIDGSPLPTHFPFVPITKDPPLPKDPTLLAAYPAGFLDGSIIEMNLYASTALANIIDVFTFTKDTADLVSVGGTIVSQAGSSGGAVVRAQDGALLAIIATASEGTTTAMRDLRAITLGHIDRSLKSQGEAGVVSLLTSDLTKQADSFAADTAPLLTKKLIGYLAR